MVKSQCFKFKPFLTGTTGCIYSLPCPLQSDRSITINKNRKVRCHPLACMTIQIVYNVPVDAAPETLIRICCITKTITKNNFSCFKRRRNNLGNMLGSGSGIQHQLSQRG